MQYAMQLPNDDDGKTQNRITELQYNNTTNNDQFKFFTSFPLTMYDDDQTKQTAFLELFSLRF